MNLEEFTARYPFGQKRLVAIACDDCECSRNVTRANAEKNIIKNGKYLCPSCAMKKNHRDNPRGEETREKQRQGRLGIILSDETKQKMSSSRKSLFRGEKGAVLREALSAQAARQHAKNKFTHGHLRGYYLSSKMNKPVYFGSSYELRCQYLLDKDPKVSSFESQIEIKVGNRSRALDLVVQFKDGSCEVYEIKPKDRLSEEAVIQQIADGKQFASDNNFKYKIWTEDDSGLGSYAEIRKWASDYILDELGGIDHEEIRKGKRQVIMKRHYDNKISQNKVDVHCECGVCDGEKVHTILRLMYENNIKRNGKYISKECSDKKSKNKGSQNPYESEGKKKCSGECQQILDLDHFSISNKATGKRCSQCKECRAKVATARYQAKRIQ